MAGLALRAPLLMHTDGKNQTSIPAQRRMEYQIDSKAEWEEKEEDLRGEKKVHDKSIQVIGHMYQICPDLHHFVQTFTFPL